MRDSTSSHPEGEHVGLFQEMQLWGYCKVLQDRKNRVGGVGSPGGARYPVNEVSCS